MSFLNRNALGATVPKYLYAIGATLLACGIVSPHEAVAETLNFHKEGVSKAQERRDFLSCGMSEELEISTSQVPSFKRCLQGLGYREVSSTSQEAQRSRVYTVQEHLNRLGYNAGPVDGQMGSRTRRAIEEYQRAKGVAVTGAPSDDLIAMLAEDRTSKRTVTVGVGRRDPRENYEAVGAIRKPGCEGLEVVEYFQNTLPQTGQRIFYIAIRNRNTFEQYVEIDFESGNSVGGRRLRGPISAHVPAGDLKQVEIDFGDNAPKFITITRCL